MHEAIQVEKKYHATLHLFNQSQQLPKLECTPNHFLETTHTQQQYENNEAFQKNKCTNQKPNPDETKMSKNEKKEFEESSNANYDFHWPDGNISFQVPNSQLMEDGWAYFGYALCPLYSTKATLSCHHSIHYYCLGVHKCHVEGCPFLQWPKQQQGKRTGAPPKEENYHCPKHPDQDLE